MAKRYQGLIEEYCGLGSVAVPPGFGRNAPSRYVIIRTDFAPPKLVGELSAGWILLATPLDKWRRGASATHSAAVCLSQQCAKTRLLGMLAGR